MSSSVDTLASFIQSAPIALVTFVAEDGRPRTRPMKTLPGHCSRPSHIWLRAGGAEAVREIGRGADVSLVYGSAECGRYVTVYGRAIVLTEPASAISALQKDGSDSSKGHREQPILCVTALGVEVWDLSQEATPRMLAFPQPQPISGEAAQDTIPTRGRRGPRLRLVELTPAL